MTAEIAVLNRQGIALAADSAVTSSIGERDKISFSANKLFALSYRHPIGIMVYGNSMFMDIPWETIIKYYRSVSLPKVGFNTLEEYANHFISFLNCSNIQSHGGAEQNYIGYFALSLFEDIRRHIVSKLEKSVNNGQDIDENRMKSLMDGVVKDAYQYFSSLETVYISKEESKKLTRKYNKDVQTAIDMTFDSYPITKEFRAKLKEIMIVAFSKAILNNVSSGVVIAGFGEKETLPTIKAFKIEGIIRVQSGESLTEILKYDQDKDGSSSSDTNAAVIPYAQAEDMACRFMEGVDPLYKQVQYELLFDLFRDYAHKVASQLSKYTDVEKKKILRKLTGYGDRMAKEFNNSMMDFARGSFIRPTVSAVARLNKNELAAMAEALVYVTSLKRKVSSDSETVAEPIDVAIITKGDGFIWIKRKQYFDPKLNPMYFINRNKEVTNEDDKLSENPRQPVE